MELYILFSRPELTRRMILRNISTHTGAVHEMCEGRSLKLHASLCVIGDAKGPALKPCVTRMHACAWVVQGKDSSGGYV